ncbi:MAG: glycosyltransferase family 1 protein, partial [Microcystaceae cyanobacterium]
MVSDLSSKGAGRWGGAVRPFLLAQALQRLGYEVKLFGVAFNQDVPPVSDSDFPIISVPCKYYAGFSGSVRA